MSAEFEKIKQSIENLNSLWKKFRDTDDGFIEIVVKGDFKKYQEKLTFEVEKSELNQSDKESQIIKIESAFKQSVVSMEKNWKNRIEVLRDLSE